MANNPNAIANLNPPWAPGQSGNPEGKPKGIQNWSTIVRELLEDEELMVALMEGKGKGKKRIEPLLEKPAYFDLLQIKNAGNAIVAAMIIEAMNGNDKAATWLRRTGFGEKLDITNDKAELKPIRLVDMRTGRDMVMVDKQRLAELEAMDARRANAITVKTTKPKSVQSKKLKPKKAPTKSVQKSAKKVLKKA